MRGILKHLKGNYSIWLWLFLILLSIVLLNTNQSFKFGVTSVFSSSILYPFEHLAKYFHKIEKYRKENLRLKKELVNLSLQVKRLQETKKENQRLKRLLDFEEKIKYETKLARVIGKKNYENSPTLLINAGYDKNITTDCPVIVPEGIIGKVVHVNSSNSYVRLINDANFKISAMDARSRVIGIVQHKEGGFLKMTNVPLTADIKYGDLIVSSPHSRVFPKGLKIGTVHRVTNPQDKLFKIIDILPSADLNKIEEVFVLTSKKPEPDSSTVREK